MVGRYYLNLYYIINICLYSKNKQNRNKAYLFENSEFPLDAVSHLWCCQDFSICGGKKKNYCAEHGESSYTCYNQHLKQMLYSKLLRWPNLNTTNAADLVVELQVSAAAAGKMPWCCLQSSLDQWAETPDQTTNRTVQIMQNSKCRNKVYP